MPTPQIRFAESANREAVSDHSLRIIRDLLRVSDCPSCLITSTTRTPAAQARVMYANIVSLGVTSQLALYAPAGAAVIDEYIRGKKRGLAPVSIIGAMTAEINRQGPSNVSRHCADPKRSNVIDIAPSSIVDPVAFETAIVQAKVSGAVSRYFSPGRHDPAFHLEIPQLVA